MTGPLVDGRPFTVGVDALLLTEYAAGPDAPLSVINISDVRIWVGTTSSVGPQAGTPIDPNTSLAWTTPGQLWAVVDPAATDSAKVVLTSSTSAWTPSPASIGLQVAEAANAIPLTWISASTPAATSGGTASVTLATVTDPLWLVYSIVIVCTSTAQTIFELFADAATSANLRDTTRIGNRNANDRSTPLQFVQSQKIIAKWSSASAGAVGTINVGYRTKGA